MENYVSNLQKDIEHKYLLSLRKRTYHDGLSTQQEKIETLIKELKEQSSFQNVSSETISENETQKDTLEAINEFIFNKTWNKLAPVHRILKIKEYVNKSLSISDDKVRKELIEELTLAVKTKRLSRKDQVNYDDVKAMVISIPLLKHKNGKFYLDE
jgi:uncharacterized protein (UPF0248 family)